jgi:CubicO group peptidase (beta-lactamase class C family)
MLISCIFIGLVITPNALSLTISKQSSNIDSIDVNEKNIGISDSLFDGLIKFLMKIGHKPSVATGIISKDELVWSKGYGYYDIENEKPSTIDTLYLQASISKTITATAIMQLFEQGKFNLTDDVNDVLPFEMRNPNHPDIPITFEMILSHHSSLAYDNVYWLCLSYLPGDPDIPSFPYPWLEEYLTPGGSGYSSTTWSETEPGEQYLYANVGFSVIAFLVEILSKQDFNEYCRENIFDPLEMYNSSFRLKDHDIDSIAVPYEYINRQFFRHPHYGIHVLYPAITLRTSVEEYSHFMIAIMNGGVWNDVRILNESTIELMHTAPFQPEEKYNYGLGWQITKRSNGEVDVHHGGGYVGVLCHILMKPDREIATILFSNELDSELRASFLESRAFYTIEQLLLFKANRIAS